MSGDEDYKRMFHQALRIRLVEERIIDLYPSDRIQSPVHLSIGQEGAAVGVCNGLRDTDLLFGSYRGHAYYLAKGGDLKSFFAELFGRATGMAGGKAGSMHLAAPDVGFQGCSAVVASSIPHAVGAALAARRLGKDQRIVAVFGDGATEEGVFHESLNFAALKKLPVLFVCENNQFAIHQPLSKRWATDRLCERVETYGIPAHHIADSNVETVRDTTAAAIEDIRAGKGPAFIECVTYRWREHVGPDEDYDDGYRVRADVEAWRDKDEVVRLAAALDPAARRTIDDAIEAEIAEAIAFAEDSPFPEQQELYANVFAN